MKIENDGINVNKVLNDDPAFASLIRPATSKKTKLFAERRTLDPLMINHKNLPLLRTMISPGGRILSRRLTGLSALQQRKVKVAISRARILGLLPFCDTHK